MYFVIFCLGNIESWKWLENKERRDWNQSGDFRTRGQRTSDIQNKDGGGIEIQNMSANWRNQLCLYFDIFKTIKPETLDNLLLIVWFRL